MNAFEVLVVKKSEYRWPILKGNTKENVSVKFLDEYSLNKYIFNEKVMTLGEWNKAAKSHNKRKERKK